MQKATSDHDSVPSVSNAGVQGAQKEVPKRPGVARNGKKRSVSSLVRNGWLTRQHGGWPMTIVPVLAGSALGGFTWLQLLLAVSWVIAFLWFDAFTVWMKTTVHVSRQGTRRVRLARGQRYVPALVTYGLIAFAGAVALAILWPKILLWGLAILPCFLVAWLQMWRGEYQSFLARASAIVASSLLTPIAYELGSHPDNWYRAWVSTAFIATYFVGTIPYVKTLIRERGNPTWTRISLGYHLVMTVAAVFAAAVGYITWWMALAWMILTVRAWAYPEAARRRGKPLRPAVIGVSEFAFTAVVLFAVLVN